MSTSSADPNTLVALYDTAMPQVYGYLHRRTRHRASAEDITTEVFLAAMDSIHRGVVDEITTAWLISIARHKLVDHWRRTEREHRRVGAVAADTVEPEEPWAAQLDQLVVADVLADLGAHHRSALTLRYVDDLPVPEVADTLDRTVHATEALLVRARRAFRIRYEEVAT